jgi:hypothetical protein
MLSGTIGIKWDAAGHLTINCSEPLNGSENKKAAIDKLLDAARAINDMGTALELAPTSSKRILSANIVGA